MTTDPHELGCDCGCGEPRLPGSRYAEPKHRQRASQQRKKAAQPVLRVVDGTGDDLALAPHEELGVLAGRLVAVAATVQAWVVEAEPERLDATVACLEATAAAERAQAAAAYATARAAQAAADDAAEAAAHAEDRAAAAVDAAVAAEARAASAEARLSALGAEHDEACTLLRDAESRVARLAERVVDLEDELGTARGEAVTAAAGQAMAEGRLELVVRAFASAADAIGGDDASNPGRDV